MVFPSSNTYLNEILQNLDIRYANTDKERLVHG